MLVLAGTTAVGKTDVSIPLAEILKGEIISADSRQIFRELEIATAKPTAEQMQRVKHHFIDEKSISERWTAGDFARQARNRIEVIAGHGNTPLVVGGSMLYLRALLDGFYDAEEEPSADYAALREELTARGAEEMYRELESRDPGLAAKTDPRDHHRILRGIAVHRQQNEQLSKLQMRRASSLGFPFHLYFLVGDRQETYERVNARVQRMIESGLVDEVRALWKDGWDETKCNALRTHGYQEVFPYLRGEISYEDMIDNIQKAVRHYVKRQITWFRSDPRTIWFERTFDEPDEMVARRIAEDFLRQARP